LIFLPINGTNQKKIPMAELGNEAAMVKTTHGKVHGRMIELDHDLGLAEGQEVEVEVKIVGPSKAWGEGLRRCAGSLADEWTEEDDRVLEQIHQERKQDSRREISE
jgi:hypothetical protein